MQCMAQIHAELYADCTMEASCSEWPKFMQRCMLFRYGLVVRIPGSHPGGPGSIPGNGNFYQLFFGKSRSPSPFILLRLSRTTNNNCELFKTADRCVKCLSVGAIEKAIPLYYSS